MNPEEDREDPGAALELFEELCERSPEERRAELARCADARVREEVERLLAHYDRDDSLLDRGLGLQLETVPLVLPERIGPYRVRSLLGTGGMGVVYLAEQRTPQREVAVKVLQSSWPGSERARRFAREAQLLGRLQHPGIAQIFESGATSETAEASTYIAMEYVDGLPLTRFASEAGLDAASRVRLLIDLADAVHHAHLRGVLHRDLKPSNVLVTADRQVKVIDFGVARALEGDDEGTLRTLTGQIVGTVAYMSPEQVRGAVADVDARADVYALGVMAYELLAGELPFDLRDLTLTAAARVVCDTDAARLGTRSPGCRGDLEQIVAKAMEKEPARRYQSAAALADDLRRFLNDEPVEARPASAIYQLRKVTRRHRAVVVGALTTLLALLIGTGVAVTYALRNADLAELERAARAEADREAVRALDQADLARRSAEEAEARTAEARELAEELDVRLRTQMRIAGFQADLIAGLDLARMGEDIQRAVLEDARAAARRAGPGTWTDADIARAERYLQGVTPINVARRALKESYLDGIRAAIDEEFADTPAEHVRMLDGHGALLLSLGFFADAVETNRATLAVLREAGISNDTFRVGKTLHLAEALASAGDLDGAERLIDSVEDEIPAAFGDDPKFERLALELRASIAGQRGQPELAESLSRELLALGGEEARVRRNIATALLQQGRNKEAEDQVRELLAGLARDPTPIELELLGMCRLRGEDAEGAALLFEEALVANRALEGDGHPSSLRMRFNLASALVRLERYEETARVLEETLAGHLARPSPPTETVVSVELFLAQVLWELGALDEANRHGRDALSRARSRLGEDHPLTRRVLAGVEAAAAESSD